MTNFYNSASFISIAGAYKDNKVYAIKPTNGSGDVSYASRGTSGSRTNSNNSIEQMGSNIIRLDYQFPQAKTNFLLYSNDFSNANWSKGDLQVTASSIVSPDGTLNGWKFNGAGSATGSAPPYMQQAILNQDNTFTFSIFAKQGEYNWLRFLAYGNNPGNDFDTTPEAKFDLSNGTVGYNKNCVPKIESYGNGWYRCIVQATSSINQSKSNILFYVSTTISGTLPDSGVNFTNAFRGGQGLYIYGAQMETSTTSSATTYIPTTDTAASSTPTPACPSFLFETQRTNILTYSNAFSTSPWGAVETTVTASAITSPDGTLNGWKLNETTANNTHTRRQTSVNVTSGERYIVSAYVKPAERTQCAIQSNLTGGGFLYTKFNLNGTGSVYYTPTGYTGSITPVSGGWFRISTSAISNATTGKYFSFDLVSGSTYTETYAGTSNTTGIYIYGAQIESGSYLTSYIPTTAATVTRNGDYPLSIPTSSDPYNFTLFHVGTFEANEENAGPSIQITSGSTYIGFYGTTGKASYTGGGVVGSNVSTGSEHKMLVKFQNNNTASWFVDGVKIHSQSISIANPSWDRIILNRDIVGSISANQAPARYRIVAVFPSALSDADCITLTT